MRVGAANIGSTSPAGAPILLDNNQMIFNEGDEARYYYRVLAGWVRLYRMRCNGRRQIIELQIPGDIFGFEYGAQHTLIGEAIGRTTLERYPRQAIEQLSEQELDVRRHLVITLHRSLAAARNHVLLLGQDSAKERVAAFLATMARRFNIRQCGVLELRVGRLDIADYTGLALETVCRELSIFQREGLIDILDHRRVKIRNLKALQSISDGPQQ
ncbi:MAG: helix-turn-helix domain-containing protein [Alphaproteobacteria bacterium]|nr:helix-turn-helix domain-containing protein [Alphaproteobacteria bacterium]MDE2014258.1 helix-turn-helix domain-containing protein [Alphaproteobacteria bacterium]